MEEFKCRLCPSKLNEESEIREHCVKHLADDPTRLRGGSLNSFLLKQYRKPFNVRSAPYTTRPEGTVNTININTFVHLSSFLDNVTIDIDGILALAAPTAIPRKRQRLSSPVLPLLSLSLSTPRDTTANSTPVPKSSMSTQTPSLLPSKSQPDGPSPSADAVTLPLSMSGPTSSAAASSVKHISVHPLSHRKHSRVASNSKSFRCNKCPFRSSDQQIMEDHVFSVHDLKDLVLICKLCQGHFSSGSALQSHVLLRHPRRTDEVDEISSVLIETRVISYRTIPFCKKCKYANFQLFDKSLGCFCDSKIPTPGQSKDCSSIPTHVPPPCPIVAFTAINLIPEAHVCLKTGKPFHQGRPKTLPPPPKITFPLSGISKCLEKLSVDKSAVAPSFPAFPASVPIHLVPSIPLPMDTEDPLPPMLQ